MKSPLIVLLSAVLISFPLAASADPGKDESGHGKGRSHDRREYKEEYWDGNCKVERKLEKNGDYKEERKCKSPRRNHDHYGQAPVYVPAPVVVPPGVTIHGTIRVKP